jgi:hypothetical protein
MGFDDPTVNMIQFVYCRQAFFHPFLLPFFHPATHRFFTLYSSCLLQLDRSVLTFQHNHQNLYFMAIGKTIPVSTANDMIKGYFDYMTKQGVDMNKQTQSVSFTGSTVMEWLSTVMPRADELRVFMGFYPEGHAQAGRTTVILWPYKDGRPATKPMADGKDGGGNEELDPFNEGTGQP